MFEKKIYNKNISNTKLFDENSLDSLWNEYSEDKSKVNVKEKLLLHYVPLVRIIAGRMMISLPNHISMDDLVSDGLVGLINGLDLFDLKKEVKFETYANIKIRGAILDGLRQLDWMPRGLREKNTILENATRAAEIKSGRAPTDQEIADELKVSMDEYLSMLNDVKVVSLLSLDSTLDYSEGTKRLIDYIEDKDANKPDEIVERAELRSILVFSIKELKELEKNVIALYYYEQLTLKEIGEVLSVSESRVSQIHTKIIILLRNKIKDYLLK